MTYSKLQFIGVNNKMKLDAVFVQESSFILRGCRSAYLCYTVGKVASQDTIFAFFQRTVTEMI